MMRKKKEKAQEKGQLSSKGNHLRVFQRTPRSHLVVGKRDIKGKKKEATRGRVRKKKRRIRKAACILHTLKKKETRKWKNATKRQGKEKKTQWKS